MSESKAKFVDLYYLVVSVSTDQVRARCEKFRMKWTPSNFLPVRLTAEEEAQGYSHSYTGRVKVEELKVVQNNDLGHSPDHIRRSMYCFKEQREEALNLLRAEVESTLARRLEYATKMAQVWKDRNNKVEEQPKRERKQNAANRSAPAVA